MITTGLIFDLIGFVSVFLLGAVCFRQSRMAPNPCVTLFWVGITFMFIGLLRILSTFGFLDTNQSRLAIGLFYPFVLGVILLETRKAK